MGAFGNDGEKQSPKEHQWDYFNLSDFKSKSCWAAFSYGILYITLFVSVACYVLDIITCSQLIIADRWQGQIKVSPLVPFEIARWVFTGCIFLSLIFLVYRWWKAIRAMKSGSVVASYLDPLAVRIQSIRMGRGQGWRRFLVFAELTKSKKGAEYVALFSYLSFEASFRILFAEGPRQVINGITIYSIMRSEIIPLDGSGHAAPIGHSPIVQFFLNVKILAQGNALRAVFLFGMVFTLFIWIIAALSLLSACILYIMFLWHHIPSGDGGLKGYCKRKVDSKLQSIVDKKIKKAMEREEKQRIKEEARAVRAGQPVQRVQKQPTLPVLALGSDDKLPEMPMLSRQPTFATLPAYESRPGTPNMQGQLGSGDNSTRPGMPSRTATQISNDSYASSNTPLVRDAAPMGYSQSVRPYSPSQMSTASSDLSGRPSLGRNFTGQSNLSQSTSRFDPRPLQPMRPMGPPSRQNTNSDEFVFDRQYTPAPSMRSNNSVGDSRFTQGPPRRENPSDSNATGYFSAVDRAETASVASGNSSYGRQTPHSSGDRSYLEQGIEMPLRQQPIAAPSNQNFRSYSPALSAPGRGPRIPFIGNAQAFASSYTQSSSNSFDRPYIPRSDTAPPQTQHSTAYNNVFDGRRGPPVRSATAGPTYEEWPQHGL